MSEIELILDKVAEVLAWLEPPPVFLGGATIGLFLDAFGRSQMRSTSLLEVIKHGVRRAFSESWSACHSFVPMR